MSPRFALLGTAAAVADRHLRAIDEVGGELIASVDPAGVPASVAKRFPSARAFEHIDRFEAFLREGPPVDQVVVCTPNHLHLEHTTLGLRLGADVICEKPVALDPGGVDRLAEVERETGRKVNAILQLRLHPEIQRMAAEAAGDSRHQVELDYVLARGPEFFESWHGREQRSGGLIFEIGIHFLDLMLAIFGEVRALSVHQREAAKVSGELELARADVRWRLSVDPQDVPPAKRDVPVPSHRVLMVDGRDYDLGRGRGTVGLHTQLYRDILAGGGYGLAHARAAIELADRIRTSVPDLSQAPR
jgi:UDP-N-acetyl-2-amino-2-deoxyglucuronate dehydrogenase